MRRLPRRVIPVIVQVLVMAALGCRQDTESPSAPPSQALAGTLTTALSFRQISTAFNHTCALTTTNRAYCWGFNSRGQVGDGTAGGNSGTPAAVLGGLQFQQVRPGRTQTCGVTTNNRAFCWGLGGTLGDGTSNNHSTPVAVVGGLQFRQVSAGGNTAGHTCGVTLGNVAYCWGENFDGQLGDGTTTSRTRPVLVHAGVLRFLLVSAGAGHSCGVTTNKRVYCWGTNGLGQLGDGTTTNHRTPVPVFGGLTFDRVSAGGGHTCAETPLNQAYCWGTNNDGQLGDGTTVQRLKPVKVTGGLLFSQMSAGHGPHTCAVTPQSKAYCWGLNFFGEIGDNTTHNRSSPAAVAGGLSLRQVTAGEWHSCGVSSLNKAYCWGRNQVGQLGTGGIGNPRLKPVPVAGAM